MPAPVLPNEEARLEKLREYQILDSGPEKTFDDIARLASQICGTPFAAVCFLDRDRQWFKSRFGFDTLEIFRESAFCAHAIVQPDLLHVTDARLDPRFCDNPFVTGDPGIRFYAGVPLRTPDGQAIGTLCVLDLSPRDLSDEQRESLRSLSQMVVAHLEMRRSAAERECLLIERERTLSALMGNLPGMVYRCRNDEHWTIEFVSQGCRDLTGYAPAELVAGGTFDDLTEPEHRPAVREQIRAALAGRQPFRLVYPIVTQDGERKWVWEQGNGVFSPDGALLHIEGFVTDITERRRAEEALWARERQMQALVGSLDDIAFEYDATGTYLNVWTRDESLLARPKADLIGRDVVEVLGAELGGMLLGIFQRVIARRQAERVEYALDLPQGKRWFLARLSPVPAEDGACRSVCMLTHDVTERKDAEEALRERTQMLGSVLKMVPHYVFWKDRDLIYRGCNANLARDTGLASPDEMVGKTDFDFGWLPEQAESFRRLDRQVMETGEALMNEEQTFRGADGGEMVGLMSKTPLRDADGQVVGVLGVFHDITDRKVLEAEREDLLSETERLLAEAVERADRDSLTGLLNHRAFHKRLEEETSRAQRQNTSLAVVMLDLDNFKFFNDAYGHLTGDDVLRQVAAGLKQHCRPYDVLARFGGDEFALLMPNLTAAAAERLTERILANLDGKSFVPPGHDTPIPVNLSAGLAVFPDEAAGRLEVVEIADARLRLAKSGGDAAVVAAQRVRGEVAGKIEGFSMLDALVAAVDNKDRYTRRHSEDVLSYSLAMAEVLGLDAPMQQTIAVAALLHDVGKIGVPDHVLRKPGKLTEAEYEAMKQHPQMGAIIVGAVPGFEGALDAIRHHHERWDGGGYPFGLQGPQIPLLARLMAVADAFSAMTTDRPYRKGMPESKAWVLLQDGAGTQWDAACVSAFLRTREGAEADGGTVSRACPCRRPR